MTIAEVSKKYGLTADTLRYYERIGLIPSVPRNKNGIRNFDESSCGWVEFIKCMRASGLSIEALTKYVALFEQGDHTIPERKELLKTQRDELVKKMEEIKITIDRLNYKIEVYDDKLGKKEKELLKRTP